MGFSHVVVGQRHHATHAVVNVVAVQANKKHHNSRNSCPENFKGQISLDGHAVAKLAVASPKANQAEDEKTNDPDKQDAANRE